MALAGPGITALRWVWAFLSPLQQMGATHPLQRVGEAGGSAEESRGQVVVWKYHQQRQWEEVIPCSFPGLPPVTLQQAPEENKKFPFPWEPG